MERHPSRCRRGDPRLPFSLDGCPRLPNNSPVRQNNQSARPHSAVSMQNWKDPKAQTPMPIHTPQQFPFPRRDAIPGFRLKKLARRTCPAGCRPQRARCPRSPATHPPPKCQSVLKRNSMLHLSGSSCTAIFKNPPSAILSHFLRVSAVKLNRSLPVFI
jgi:hypothetical protein